MTLSRPTNAQQETARVIDVDGDRLLLQGSLGEFSAKRATSCLVKPREDDIVLVTRTEDGWCYVLSILERGAPGKTEIQTSGDLEIGTDNGTLTLHGAEGVRLTTREAVSMVCGAMRCIAQNASFLTRALLMKSNAVEVQADHVDLTAQAVDRVVGRVSERIQRSYRRIDETEVVRARQLALRAEQLLDLRGKNALLTGETLVKLDAAQVQLG